MQIGCDVLILSRVKDKIKSHVLSKDEEKLFASLKTCEEKQIFLGSRFSLKEALFKAGLQKPMTLITILKNDAGAPFVLNEPLYKISLSHEKDLIFSVALYTGKTSCEN